MSVDARDLILWMTLVDIDLFNVLVVYGLTFKKMLEGEWLLHISGLFQETRVDVDILLLFWS